MHSFLQGSHPCLRLSNINYFPYNPCIHFNAGLSDLPCPWNLNRSASASAQLLCYLHKLFIVTID
ncbi:hypothetical protein M405DRAFT_464735 [Rhizopogon salebrosus TDB-379]|nr:hypothetical protein M405DRAFT_464735 [Rhizopogon salebrosus TDB-379]